MVDSSLAHSIWQLSHTHDPNHKQFLEKRNIAAAGRLEFKIGCESRPAMSKYVKLVKSGTEYARRMKHLSNRIFGEVTRTTTPSSMRVVRMFSEEPLYLKEGVVNYYPRHVEMGKLMLNLREYGLFRDEHEDFREEMVRLRALRGKGPPPRKTKEEGKRYKKKMAKLQAEAEAKAAAERPV